MPVGANAGGNLNLFMFEVGMITRQDNGTEKVQFVSLHPMVVAPTSIQYDDNSRSPIVQTVGGSVKTVSGRAHRRVAMRGTFGQESRGLALYIGTGETRFQRFYKEVVRMPEALSKGDVDEAVDYLRGTPFIKLLLLPYDPERTIFYINFWDFWNEIEFACTIRSWQHTRSFNNGGASGLVHYNMVVEEEGPIVTGSLVTTIIKALFDALTFWSAITVSLKKFNETLAALNNQWASGQAVMQGRTTPSGDNLLTYMTNADAVAATAKAIANASESLANTGFQEESGAVGWSETEGEGSNAGLDRGEAIEDLLDVADAAAWQLVVGALYGMDRPTYQAYVTGESESQHGPSVAGTFKYTVGPTDTEQSIAERFGITWDFLLDVNGMTPDEAMLEGTELLVPRQKGVGAQAIDGLPTFGSHLGRAAWGTDLRTDLAAQDGDLVILSDGDVLEQGVDWIIDVFGAELVDVLNNTPEIVRVPLLQRKLRALLLQDLRIAGLDDVQTEITDTGFNIQVTVTAINGETIQTGRIA
jgi:hypothetical protein